MVAVLEIRNQQVEQALMLMKDAERFHRGGIATAYHRLSSKNPLKSTERPCYLFYIAIKF